MAETLSILLLEDDPRDAMLIEETLQSGGVECRVTRVESRSGFTAELEKKDAYALILADYSLPGFDGLTALEITRRECPDIPFIFVSGSLGEEIAIEALKIGATDYVLKSRLSRIVPSVQRAIREKHERAELDRVERALRRSEDARLEERARIAGDLHDTLLQSMQGLVLLLSAAEGQLSKNSDKAHLTLTRALQRAQVALSEGRDAVFELRASPARDLEGLIREAGLQLAADQQSQLSLPAAELAVAVHGVPFSLPQAIQYEVNRIALEAVRNAFRHSSARRIDVDIDYGDSSFDLSVHDHGRGISSADSGDLRDRGHWGITGMRERASRVGGQLWIESQVGQGTKVRFSLPRTGVAAGV